jgi:hypothetical protein
MDARPICHEAGHIVVALHFGFRVDCIEVFQGRYRTRLALDDTERTDQERCVVLAGGIAGEELDYPNYDPGACGADQQLISKLNGGSIDNYLPAALDIVRAKEPCFRELRKRITIRVLEEQMVMSIAGSGNSFTLLTDIQIRDIWQSP